MSLTTPASVQKLQTALPAKAKEAPNFRFHALYDKVYRKDVLAYAYERCDAKGGAAGVEEQTFEDIKQSGVERGLDELAQELKNLTVNENKTRVCHLPEEKFDFLGYRFGRCYSPKTGRAYWGTTPSKKRVQRLCKSISEMTRRSQTQQDVGTLVEALNRKINGWANYFCLGPVRPAYRAVEQHTCRRLRQWLCAKPKERAGSNTRFPQPALHQKFGLVRLTARTASFPWATP